MEFIEYILNLVLVVPIVILLFFITMKLGKTSFSKMGMYNHVSVLEKVNLSKDSSVLVLKMGEEGCVGILTPSGFQVVQKLDSERIKEVEDKKNQFFSQQQALDLKSKISIKKNNLEENCADLFKKQNTELKSRYTSNKG